MSRVLAAAAAFVIAASAGVAQEAPAALQGGDAAEGEKVYRKCRACHMVGEDAKNRVGPQLNDLFGRTPGGLEDYNYSSAMKSYGEEHVWNAETLASYLAAPREVVDGTKMAFAGLRKEEEIAHVLTYLAQYDENGATVE